MFFKFAITDIIFLVALSILSIVSAVRESQLQNQSILVNSIDIRSYYNLGSFASAAFFGLLSCIIYIVLIVAWVILHQRKRRHNKVNNSRQSNKSQITNVNNIDTTISSDFDAKHRYEIRETPVNPERQFSEEIWTRIHVETQKLNTKFRIDDMPILNELNQNSSY